MSAFGERISANTKQNTIRVEVAEWGDENEPMVLFATPLNAGEFTRLQKKHPNFLNNMTVEGLIDMLLMKAMDGEGNKAFDLGDKPVLMRQPVGLISNVAGQLMGDVASVEEVKKD